MNSSDELINEELSPAIKAEIFFRVIFYVVGVVGNALVIFVILFLNEYKKTTHWYVLQLAIADLLFLQILPVRVSDLINGRSDESVALCRASQTILYLNYYASILFLVVMALDRYLAVCHALSTQLQRLRSRSYAFVITAIVWIIACMLCIPIAIYSDIGGVWPSCRCTINFPRVREQGEWCAEEHITNDTECEIKFDQYFSNPTACVMIPGQPDLPINSNIHGVALHSSSIHHNYINESGSASGSASGSGDKDFSDNETTSDDDYHYDGDYDLSDYFDYDKDDVLIPECFHNHESPGFYTFLYLNFAVMFIIPFVVISVCYSLIVIRILNTNIGERNAVSDSSRSRTGSGIRILSRIRRSSSNASTGKSHKEKRRVTVMCAILVLLFLVCWLPFHSVHLAKIHGIPTHDANFCNILSKVTSLIVFANSALNPFVYNFLGTFHKRMRQVKNHRRMRSLLSITGLTRISGNRSRTGSVYNSSDDSKPKRTSSVRNGTRYTGPQSEGIPLQTFQDKSTVS